MKLATPESALLESGSLTRVEHCAEECRTLIFSDTLYDSVLGGFNGQNVYLVRTFPRNRPRVHHVAV